MIRNENCTYHSWQNLIPTKAGPSPCESIPGKTILNHELWNVCNRVQILNEVPSFKSYEMANIAKLLKNLSVPLGLVRLRLAQNSKFLRLRYAIPIPILNHNPRSFSCRLLSNEIRQNRNHHQYW